MSITATELKANLSKYLQISATEDVYITRNGKVISKLTNPFQERSPSRSRCSAFCPMTSRKKKRAKRG